MARRADLEEAYIKRVSRIGEFLGVLEEGHGACGLEGGVVTGLSIRLPTDERPDCLLVVRVTSPEGRFVGFVGGLGVAEVILAWRKRDGAKGLAWREDKPWGGGGK